MFNLPPREKTGLDVAIDDLLIQMAAVEADSPEYNQISDQYVKLMKLQSEVGRKRVSPDTWAAILANLGGILIIVGYEQKNIITTKALPFLKRVF